MEIANYKSTMIMDDLHWSYQPKAKFKQIKP